MSKVTYYITQSKYDKYTYYIYGEIKGTTFLIADVFEDFMSNFIGKENWNNMLKYINPEELTKFEFEITCLTLNE